jgi:alpha,alpha-trehalose phosphorylase
MARFNMRYAAWTLEFLRVWDDDLYAALVRNTGVTDDEIVEWRRAADAMYLPYDEDLGINPQDESFLDREPWDFASTPPEKYPLLLHFHPLVIYRFQILKQADVVLAMFLQGQHFSLEEKRRNFEYYDPITTGDSSLSACVEGIIAAEVGHDDLAADYFDQSLYLDLADTHGNTSDGVHIANAGGVWAGVIHGFAGLVDNGEYLRFQSRLPKGWDGVRFRLQRHGSEVAVTVDETGCTVELVGGAPVPLRVGDETVFVHAGEPVRMDNGNMS